MLKNTVKVGKTEIKKILKVGTEEEIIQDGNEISDQFNKYFQQFSSKIVGKISTYNLPTVKGNPPQGIAESMFLNPVVHEEVDSIISSLKSKKFFGIDEISSSILKDCRKYITDPLVHIINLSFKFGQFPDSLKVSKIKPLYKNGNKMKMENYRPISLLPSVSKIFEIFRSSLNRLGGYLNKYNILVDEQHGFRKGKSTKTALTTL